MKVTVKLSAGLRKAAQANELEVNATTAKDLVASLKTQFQGNDEFLKTLKLCHMIINGTNVLYLQGTGTRLSEGDVVTLVPPIGGG